MPSVVATAARLQDLSHPQLPGIAVASLALALLAAFRPTSPAEHAS